MKSIPQGAATTIYAATAPELATRNGIYLSDCVEKVADFGGTQWGSCREVMGFVREGDWYCVVVIMMIVAAFLLRNKKR